MPTMSFDRVQIYHDISLPSSFTYLPTSTVESEIELSFNRYLQVLFRLDFGAVDSHLLKYLLTSLAIV